MLPHMKGLHPFEDTTEQTTETMSLALKQQQQLTINDKLTKAATALIL